jgi:sugar (pentulose or hexulose) kinase
MPKYLLGINNGSTVDKDGNPVRNAIDSTDSRAQSCVCAVFQRINAYWNHTASDIELSRK